ncbi:MAG: hypothetical protein JNL84_04560 [Candidatus Accumulibacter sp.]|nr:hypothetical protein [Accumulibacter sp.]
MRWQTAQGQRRTGGWVAGGGIPQKIAGESRQAATAAKRRQAAQNSRDPRSNGCRSIEVVLIKSNRRGIRGASRGQQPGHDNFFDHFFLLPVERVSAYKSRMSKSSSRTKSEANYVPNMNFHIKHIINNK